MKVFLGVLGGGVAGYLLSKYVLPSSVAITCGSNKVMVNSDGTITLPNGSAVSTGLVCSVAGIVF